jgi:hypothetical protein
VGTSKQDPLIRPNPPRRVFFGRRFEFTSALAVKECASRLQRADQMPTGCFNPPIFVSVYPESGENFTINMYVEARVGKAWVIGTLQPVNSVTTHVAGRFGAGPEIVVLGVLLFAFVPIVVYAYARPTPGEVVGFSVFLISLLLVIFWYNLHWARSKLFKVFEQIMMV